MPDTYPIGSRQSVAQSYDATQAPQTDTPPGAEQASGAPAASKGPFSAYLDPSQTREPTHTASKERPSGYMGTAGKMAYFADQLLGGIAKGRAMAYNRSIQQQASTYKRLDQAAQDIQSNPNLTDDDRQKLMNRLYQFKAQALAGAVDPDAAQGDGQKKGKKKDGDGKGNPIVTFIKDAALRLAGPGAQPQPITPQSVNQVLGEVYSSMSQVTGARQQLGEAWSNIVKAIGTASQKGAKTEGELMADPDVQSAISKYAPLGGEKGQKSVMDLLKGTANTLNSTRVDVQMADGTVVPGNRLRDGTITDLNNNAIAPSAIKAVGTNFNKPAKKTDIHWQDKEGEWHLGKEDAEGNKFTQDDKPIAASDIVDVNRTGAKPERYTGVLGQRLAAQKIIDNPKSSKAEVKQAKATLSTLDTQAQGVVESNDLKTDKLTRDKEKAEKGGAKAEKPADMAARAMADIHPTEKTAAADETDRKAILNRSIDPDKAAEVAAKWTKRAISNVKNKNNYTDWTDEQRGKVVIELEKMPQSRVYNILSRTEAPPGAATPVPNPKSEGKPSLAATPEPPKTMPTQASKAYTNPKTGATIKVGMTVKTADGRTVIVDEIKDGKATKYHVAAKQEIAQASASH